MLQIINNAMLYNVCPAVELRKERGEMPAGRALKDRGIPARHHQQGAPAGNL